LFWKKQEEEQATDWSQFKGFSKELTAPGTGHVSELLQYTDLNVNPT
jgi:hypothetical protein